MVVDMGELPIWQGVQTIPGFMTFSFVLEANNDLIRLALPPAKLDSIVDEYREDSYHFITSPPGTSNWGNRLGDWYFSILVEQVGDLAGKRILEIGAGTLYIAEKVVQELRADLYWVCDPALRDESGLERIEVVRDYFSGRLFREQYLDLIISINTLEHILDLREHLADVRALLRQPDGMVYLVVPDCSRGLESGDVGICVHEHISFFTPESLQNLLADCGFQTKWLYSSEDTIFALAGPGTQLIKQIHSDKNALKLLDKFERKVRDNLRFAQNLLLNKKEYKNTAVHGCSVGLNNMLYLLGIYSDPGMVLFDGNSSKWGKYLPVFDKPILSPYDISYKDMDRTVIASLTYYDEITKFVEENHGMLPDQIFPIFSLD